MQHQVTIKATKYIKFNVEAPTLVAAEACALEAARKHFKIVEIIEVTDAEVTE
jgi:hypothetical protein